MRLRSGCSNNRACGCASATTDGGWGGGALVSWYVYMVDCADGSLYTGITNDLPGRLAAHNSGTGAAYTRSRRPVRLAYLELASDRAAASRRELEIKGLSRQDKERLANGEGGRSSALLRSKEFTAPHGFSTRLGGVSSGRYGSLNLGASTGDEPLLVERNRAIFLSWLGGDEAGLRLLDQVHGDRVVEALMGDPRPQEADAQMSGDPRLVLVVGTADCVPVLVHDPLTGAAGAAHCGWRGTVRGLAGKLVLAMADRFGTLPQDVRVAIGPCICADCYEVGPEVLEEFSAAGFPRHVWSADDRGRRLDLVAANRHSLQEVGVGPENVHSLSKCTMCDPQRFFSYRRDGAGRGLHWSAVRATGPGGG